jgi:uncharacterized protein YndB with AHSA1/START domain
MTDSFSSQDAVRIERSFDAPVDVVWQMWTDPQHFAAWYGPAGATMPVAKMDVRVGGTRPVCMEMQTPNGPMQMWFTGEYREVVENERLVYSESMSDENGNVLSPADMGMPEGHPEATKVRVDLEDDTGRTKMVMTNAGIPPARRARPDGRWRSTNSPLESRHTTIGSAGHRASGPPG